MLGIGPLDNVLWFIRTAVYKQSATADLGQGIYGAGVGVVGVEGGQRRDGVPGVIGPLGGAQIPSAILLADRVGFWHSVWESIKVSDTCQWSIELATGRGTAYHQRESTARP